MGNLLSQAPSIAYYTACFYGCFFHYLVGKGSSEPFQKDGGNSPFFKTAPGDSAEMIELKKYARIHCYSLALIFWLWDKPHYRKGSYREDLADNLRNVAVPGTGIPMSIFVLHKLTALWLILVLNPFICLIATYHYCTKENKQGQDVSMEFATRLLAPNDWFSYWRLNCRVAAMHAYLNDNPEGYTMENKWDFLKKGDKVGVPISPFLNTPALVIKHKNEEGGMGIYFYKNATEGGDWIIQERIDNSAWVSTMLPKISPLSTFRVITQSRAALDLSKPAKVEDVTALSCVFRAGREGAATDHDSILFDINPKTGDLLKGTTNAHWYRLGLHEVLPGRCPWRSTHHYTHHPDGNIPVTGNKMEDIKQILHLVEKSHFQMCPDVPLAGWDVVLSADTNLPVCLLEVNLSCNFFRGTFDHALYLDFIGDSFETMQQMRLKAASENKKSN
jgi:hypothetical protein